MQGLGDVGDRGDLRHADTRDHACGADRARADADLDGIGASIAQRLGGAGRGDVAADHLHLREMLFDPGDSIEHALRMAMRRVHHDHVYPGGHQFFDALLGALSDTHGGADQ